MLRRPGSLVRCLLLLAYAVLVLAVPVAPLPAWTGAKLTLAGIFLLPALVSVLLWMLIAGPKKGIRIPAVLFGYVGYLAILSGAAALSPQTAYDPLPSLAFHLVGICLVTVLVQIHSDTETLLRTVTVLGVLAGLVGAMGVAEYFGLILYDRNFSSGQSILGTFGNQNHLGGYLCIFLPFALLAVATARRRWVRIVAAGTVACSFLSILMTASRATLAGAGVASGCFVLLGAFFLFSPLSRFRSMPAGRRRALVAAATVGTAAMAAWLVTDGRLVDRFVYIADPEKFFGVRRYMYRAAVSIWCHSPQSIILGNGPGSYYRLSPAFLGSDSFFTSMSHVHNEILENLVEGGLAGLSAYLAILGFTLWKLFVCMRDRSLAEPVRWTAISLAAALIAFQAHGLFSISTRTLVVGHSYHWIVGLAWALAAGAGHGGTTVVCGRPAGAVATAMLVLLAWAAVHLDLHARMDNLLASARMAEEKERPGRAEQLYHDVLAWDPDNVRAGYFLAHLYLVHQVPEGFARFAGRTEAIIPQYRSIDYFQALMDLKEGRWADAMNGFRFVEKQVFRKDPLTLFWLAWLNARQAENDRATNYLMRYLKALFPDREIVMAPAKARISAIHRTGQRPRIRVGEKALRAVIQNMPETGSPEAVFYRISAELATLFDGRDYDIWADLYTNSLGKKKTASTRVVRETGERLKEAIADYRCNGRRSQLNDILRLYERMIRYSPPHETLIFRKKMLPYYLQDMRFKHYAHWKKRLAEKKS